MFHGSDKSGITASRTSARSIVIGSMSCSELVVKVAFGTVGVIITISIPLKFSRLRFIVVIAVLSFVGIPVIVRPITDPAAITVRVVKAQPTKAETAVERHGSAADAFHVQLTA
jgi:hypothetical protein